MVTVMNPCRNQPDDPGGRRSGNDGPVREALAQADYILVMDRA
ncbi:hypothetical protein [Paenibacillus sp. TY11]